MPPTGPPGTGQQPARLHQPSGPGLPFRGRWAAHQPIREERTALIEIQLERVRGTSWWRTLLTAPADRDATARLRFVARDLDPRHDGAVVAVGPTFVRPARPTDVASADGAGCPAMTDSLETLHEELAARGWRRDGHGAHPWSERFTRALVADS